MDILLTIIASIIPPQYLTLAVAILLALYGTEIYLASTNRFKANSTVQALKNGTGALLAKITQKAKIEELQAQVAALKSLPVATATLEVTSAGSELSVATETPNSPSVSPETKTE